MENKPVSMFDLLIEVHAGLERQGPGSPEMTVKALSFLDGLGELPRVADLGCGTGGQTMVLAQHLKGNITGLDLSPDFIRIFNENAAKRNLQGRVKGLVGSMDALPFQKEEFDLVWSEGAIDGVGFEKGLRHWHTFLKKGGYVAVSCPSWFTAGHPAEVETFWLDAGSGLDTVPHNISALQNCGYRFVAAFALPENCWTEHYFAPREAAEKALLEKYAGSSVARAYWENDEIETALYAKYKQHYGYAFYIGKKI